MTKIVGIRFRNTGKIYYFDPLDFDLDQAMHVIVETARGIEMGTVMIAPKDVEDDKVVQPLKPVIRVATDADERTIEKNREKEKEAFRICKEKIQKHELEMKLVEAEYTFDNNKLLFYFTADGRIDFRELVKDLAAVFRTRIELRQIGVRDETKIMGGIGICGRELCCKSYLTDFVPVSIKMAKEQNLSLNPTKISGVCGRLMCCLKNEEDTYEYLNSRLPMVGDSVTTDDGFHGEVNNISVLRQIVKVLIDNGNEKELREYHVDQLTFRSRRKQNLKLTPEELKALKELEDHDAEVAAEKKAKEERRSNGNGGRNGNNGGGSQGDGANGNGGNNNRGRRDNYRKDRNDRSDRPERSDRSERGDRADRPDRNDRNSRSDRTDRPERTDRSDRTDRPERTDRSDRTEQSDRNNNSNNTRSNRPDRRDGAPKQERGERKPYSGEDKNREDRNSENRSGENRNSENKGSENRNRNRKRKGQSHNHDK